MIRALIFDFDGLILDTETPDFLTWQEIYREYGLELELATWSVAIGTVGAFDPYAELEARLGRRVDRDAIRQQRQRRNAELLKDERCRPGVEGYLAEAARLGLKLAVASSSPSAWVTGHLARLGLLGRFQVLRCGDDVGQVKPDPELYRSALCALEARPSEAIAFEDSPNGILAAKRAGLFCVAVPNSLTRQLPLDNADVVVESLLERPLLDLITQATSR